MESFTPSIISPLGKITAAAQSLEDDGMKREDAALLLPLGMQTKVVYRTNLRALMDMAKVRMCTRAYWEYRELMDAIIEALSIYSDEWKFLIEDVKMSKGISGENINTNRISSKICTR